MNKPKLLITGISGFIGQALVKRLHKKYEIFGFYEHVESKKKNPQLPSENKWSVDIRFAADVAIAVNAIQPDYVIHLAARSEVANSFDNYIEVADINYKGTVILAEALRKQVPDLSVFIMASTMETYGHQPHFPFTETTEQRPMAPYAVAKVASEKYLAYMQYAYEFPFVTLRQTNTYGRHDNDFFVVERIMTQMLRGGPVNLGEKTPMRNFLYITDLVNLYENLLLEYSGVLGETFVTGPNNAISIGRLADKIAAITGYTGAINWDTFPPRPGEIYYLNSDPEKAKIWLGWEPQVSLEKGLKKTMKKWEHLRK